MNCQHCFTDIEGKISYCPECNFSYHENCWRKNKSKCVQYGCKGQTEVINNQEEKERECPFCAEKIKENAIICRFCNRELVKKEETLLIGKKNIIENFETKKNNLFDKLIVFFIIFIIGIIYFFSFAKPKINPTSNSSSVDKTISTPISTIQSTPTSVPTAESTPTPVPIPEITPTSIPTVIDEPTSITSHDISDSPEPTPTSTPTENKKIPVPTKQKTIVKKKIEKKAPLHILNNEQMKEANSN